MGKNWGTTLLIAAVVMAILVVLVTGGPGPATPNPPGTFSFGVLGDVPYYPWEEIQYGLVRESMDDHDLSWIVHVGDIFWQPCSDERYRKTLREFTALRHPVIYTPGDNEWTDCWEPRPGGYAPLERMGSLRRIFFEDPRTSLGSRPIPMVTQGDDAVFGDFVENVRWTHEGILFATLHLVGSENAMQPFPKRTHADDEASARRTQAAVAWMRDAFAEAAAMNARAVVLGFHANPNFEGAADDPYRMAYEPFLTVLEEEVEAFGKPVLALHGDDHEYVVDHPLTRRTTGERFQNFTRMQVPGSPVVGWVRVVVRDGDKATFEFHPYVVPRWKYW